MEPRPTQFTLQAGLILRDGMSAIELVRQLSDEEFQFEEVQTRRARVLTKSQILDGIYRNKLKVVVGDAHSLQKSDAKNERNLLDLSSLTEREKKKLDLRYDYVRAVIRARISRGRRDEIHDLIQRMAKERGQKPPSASAVMHWLRKYQQGDRNALTLVDRYRITPRRKRLSKEMEDLLWEVLNKEFFTKARHSVKHAYEQLQRKVDVAKNNGSIAVNDTIPSYQTVTKRIQEVDLFHRVSTREGSKRAAMVCRTAFPDGYPSYPLERVEIDHTPLNWVVICDRTGLPLGRPILSVMMDSYSGYILGFYISFYGAGLTSVCGLVKNALTPKDETLKASGIEKPWLSHGLGDEWVLDNGLEFHSLGFKQMAQLLGVDLMYCKVRTPWLKPRVERFFGGLNYLTLSKGRVRRLQTNEQRVDPYKDAAIIFSDLVHGLLKYIVDVHPFTPNWRKMARPFDLFQEGLERCPAAIYPGSIQDLKLVAGMTKTLTFSQGGVTLEGLPYGSYGFKDLAKRLGTGFKVDVKWDPDDMSEIYVQDPVTRTWIDAQCRWSEYAYGLSFNQHKHIKAHARGNLKSAGAELSLHQAKTQLHDYWLDCTRGRTRADSLKAARYAGYTSSRVEEPRVGPDPMSEPKQMEANAKSLYLSTEAPQIVADIPEFETFMMQEAS